MGRSRLIRKLSRPKGGSYYITLPPALIEALGWQAGDDIKIELEGDHLVLRKANPGPNPASPSPPPSRSPASLRPRSPGHACAPPEAGGQAGGEKNEA